MAPHPHLYSEVLTRAKSRKLTPFKALRPFIAPYRWTIAAAGVALILGAAATLAMPVAVRAMIDHGFTAEEAGNRYFLLLMGVVTFMGIASASRFYLVSWLGERVVADVRDKVFAHVLSLSPRFFETTRTGEVLSRLTADTTLIQTVVGSSVSFALRSLVMAFGSIVMMIVTSPKLAGFFIIGAPLMLAPIILFGRHVRRLSRQSQDRIADTSALAGETINAVQTVQANTHEDRSRADFHAATADSFYAAIKRTRMRAVMTALVITLVGGVVISVLSAGAADVLAGNMTGGELSQFVLYAVLLASSIGALSELWGDVQRAAGATERLVEILNTEPDITAPANPRTLPQPTRGAVRFHNVTFRYPARPEHKALQGFSLAVKPGEEIALVGPSGAGKSTVLQLLLRFFDPQEGRITLDDVDIRTLEPRDYRSTIAVVAQEPVIFAGTIEDNILYGRPEASHEEMVRAAEAAAAAEFIHRLPDGYASIVGERGITLSGGQRQRIAIARAMLRDAPLLLLDEATSALDAENERLVQQGLANLMTGRTTIVIAHRLATIQRLKRIVVMDQGRIVAEGSHTELVSRGGLYARLASLQFNEPRALAG